MLSVHSCRTDNDVQMITGDMFDKLVRIVGAYNLDSFRIHLTILLKEKKTNKKCNEVVCVIDPKAVVIFSFHFSV